MNKNNEKPAFTDLALWGRTYKPATTLECEGATKVMGERVTHRRDVQPWLLEDDNIEAGRRVRS